MGMEGCDRGRPGPGLLQAINGLFADDEHKTSEDELVIQDPLFEKYVLINDMDVESGEEQVEYHEMIDSDLYVQLDSAKLYQEEEEEEEEAAEVQVESCPGELAVLDTMVDTGVEGGTVLEMLQEDQDQAQEDPLDSFHQQEYDWQVTDSEHQDNVYLVVQEDEHEQEQEEEQIIESKLGEPEIVLDEQLELGNQGFTLVEDEELVSQEPAGEPDKGKAAFQIVQDEDGSLFLINTQHYSMEEEEEEEEEDYEVKEESEEPDRLTLVSLAGPELPDQDQEEDSGQLVLHMGQPVKEEALQAQDVHQSKDTPWLTCQMCGVGLYSVECAVGHRTAHPELGMSCVACGARWGGPSQLATHLASDHGRPPQPRPRCEHCGASGRCGPDVCWTAAKCLVCAKTFRSTSRLAFHLDYHRAGSTGACTACGKVFASEISLYRHSIYLHSTPTSAELRCAGCSRSFRSAPALKLHACPADLKEHVKLESLEPMEPLMPPEARLHSCSRCGKGYAQRSQLLTHVHTVHEEMPVAWSCFCCQLCSEAFPSTGLAIAHMERRHAAECADSAEYCFAVNSVKMIYECELCERHFGDSESLHSHRRSHPPDRPYQCKLCLATFPSFSSYSAHRESEPASHGPLPVEYSEPFNVSPVFSCEFCRRVFYNVSLYKEHQGLHEGALPYHCTGCSLRFASSGELEEHATSHDMKPPAPALGARPHILPYQCHFCFKGFAIEDALVKHIRSHTGEKPFICDQCGKRFSQSSGLYTHLKIHSSERPYACHLCARKFKIKGDRDVHVRKHSGARPYKCDVCHKAFMTQHVYSQHKKIHTGERPYKCNVCGLAFRRSHVLTVHKRIHTGEKPHTCDACGKRYRQKGDLSKHLRSQHPNRPLPLPIPLPTLPPLPLPTQCT